MWRQRSIPNKNTKNDPPSFAFAKIRKIFHAVDVQRTAKKCTKIYNARAQLLLFYSLRFFVWFPSRCRCRRWLRSLSSLIFFQRNSGGNCQVPLLPFSIRQACEKSPTRLVSWKSNLAKCFTLPCNFNSKMKLHVEVIWNLNFLCWS